MIKKDNYTTISEFEIIAPTCDIETIGEKLKLSQFGEYCPDGSMRGYPLLTLLDHPLHYRVSKIIMKGINYEIPIDREKNYLPKSHQETMKYFKGQNRRMIPLHDIMRTVDAWLKSNDTFVTDRDGKIIDGGLIDCKKGSLFERMIDVIIRNNKNG